MENERPLEGKLYKRICESNNVGVYGAAPLRRRRATVLFGQFVVVLSVNESPHRGIGDGELSFDVKIITCDGVVGNVWWIPRFWKRMTEEGENDTCGND